MIKISQSKGGLQMVGVILLLALLGIGCGGGNPANSNGNSVTPATLPGKWNLVSAQRGGDAVQANVYKQTANQLPTNTDNGERTKITGSFTLTASAYSAEVEITTIPQPGQTPRTRSFFSSGVYSINGSTMTIIGNSGIQATGTVIQNNNQLTISVSHALTGNLTAVFEKQ